MAGQLWTVYYIILVTCQLVLSTQKQRDVKRTIVTCDLGDSCALECELDHSTPPNITWHIRYVMNYPNQKLIRNKSDLAIRNFSAKNSGDYVCVSHFNQTTSTRRTYTVAYIAKPRCQEKILTNENEDVKLKCNVSFSSLDSLSFQWYGQSDQTGQYAVVKNGRSVSMSGSTATLTIQLRANKAMNGLLYTCQASLFGVTRNCSTTIRVKQFPHGNARIEPACNKTAFIGEPVVLNCHLPSNVGNSEDNWFVWSKDGAHFSLNTTQPLSFTPQSVKESGFYRCRVHNELGCSNESNGVFIEVKERRSVDQTAVFSSVIGILVVSNLVVVTALIWLLWSRRRRKQHDISWRESIAKRASFLSALRHPRRPPSLPRVPKEESYIDVGTMESSPAYHTYLELISPPENAIDEDEHIYEVAYPPNYKDATSKSNEEETTKDT